MNFIIKAIYTNVFSSCGDGIRVNIDCEKPNCACFRSKVGYPPSRSG